MRVAEARPTPAPFPDGDDDDFAEQEEFYESEAKQRDEFVADFNLLLEELADLKRYTITHPHIKEVTSAKVANVPALVAWAKRRRALKNERRACPTWSEKRRQNMVM